jgi:hypothetical protein
MFTIINAPIYMLKKLFQFVGKIDWDEKPNGHEAFLVK